MLNDLLGNVNKDIEWIRTRTIYLARHGSQAYGTNTPESDEDFRGVAIPTKEYFHGFIKRFEQLESKSPDLTIFDIRKFFSLAAQMNPNVIEILFVEPTDIISITPIGQKLLDNRSEFITKAAKERFLGYARSQMHRIISHRNWLLNKQEAPPTRTEFGLKEKPEINKDQYLTVKSQIQKQLDSWRPDFEPFSEAQTIYLQRKVSDTLTEMNITSNNDWQCAARTLGHGENFIAILQKEKEFAEKQSDWEKYQIWKRERNPVRAALEAKYGYDGKHAAHLVRLLRMGKEILLEGKVLVKRPDAEELLSIRNGAWSFEKLLEFADTAQKEIEMLYFKSTLPAQPNRVKLDLLCQQMVEESFDEL